jgi:hypothetical protein
VLALAGHDQISELIVADLRAVDLIESDDGPGGQHPVLAAVARGLDVVLDQLVPVDSVRIRAAPVHGHVDRAVVGIGIPVEHAVPLACPLRQDEALR